MIRSRLQDEVQGIGGVGSSPAISMTLTERTMLAEIKSFSESKRFSVDTTAIALTYFYRILAFSKQSHSDDRESRVLANQLKDRSALKCAAYFCIDFA